MTWNKLEDRSASGELELYYTHLQYYNGAEDKYKSAKLTADGKSVFLSERESADSAWPPSGASETETRYRVSVSKLMKFIRKRGDKVKSRRKNIN